MSAVEIDPDVAPMCPQSKDGEHCGHWEDCGACCLCHEGEIDADAFLRGLAEHADMKQIDHAAE